MKLFTISCLQLHSSYEGDVIEGLFQKIWDDHMVGLDLAVDDDLFLVGESGLQFINDYMVKETGEPLNTAVYRETENPWAVPNEE